MQARRKISNGFSLFELLVVLFLISLGYATLYSAGIGSDSQDNSLDQTKAEVREIVKYAKRLALAKGQSVAISIDSDKVSLFDSSGSAPILSPLTDTAYVVSSEFELNTFITDQNALILADGTLVTQLFFNEQGQPVSRTSPANEFSPLKNSIIVTIDDDNGSTETLLHINNVTGELM